jgi:hypothetical protein
MKLPLEGIKVIDFTVVPQFKLRHYPSDHVECPHYGQFRFR